MSSIYQRQEWATTVMEYSKLDTPTEYQTGSLEEMFEFLLPRSDHEGFTFTTWMNVEQFRLYVTLIAWLAVVSAGLGSEFLLGAILVKKLQALNKRSKYGLAVWHMIQCLFALNLVVALLSSSALGFPFLAIGLWKCGFPETIQYFMQGYVEYSKRNEKTPWCCISSAIIFEAFMNGMGTLLRKPYFLELDRSAQVPTDCLFPACASR